MLSVRVFEQVSYRAGLAPVVGLAIEGGTWKGVRNDGQPWPRKGTMQANHCRSVACLSRDVDALQEHGAFADADEQHISRRAVALATDRLYRAASIRAAAADDFPAWATLAGVLRDATLEVGELAAGRRENQGQGQKRSLHCGAS